jgi:predicted dehydrogenase
MLRLAIIGAGWAGERQVQAIQELGRKVTIACLVDNDRDFLQKKAQELQIAKIYTDYHEALNDPDIDAVSICTPHNLHCRMALDAAEAGKHILCEKPIAVTFKVAERLEQSDLQPVVAHHLADIARRAVKGDEVLFENLDSRKARRRNRIQFFGQRARD